MTAIKAYAWQFTALGLAGLVLWQTLQLHAAELDAANTRTTLATEREAGKTAALAQSETYRKRESENTRERDRIISEEQGKAAAAVDRAAGADAARHRVLADLADYLTAHRGRAQAAAAAGQCAADPAVLDVLADMYRRADDRAGQLAQIADDARGRGTTCERIHDADRQTLNGEADHAQSP